MALSSDRAICSIDSSIARTGILLNVKKGNSVRSEKSDDTIIDTFLNDMNNESGPKCWS